MKAENVFLMSNMLNYKSEYVFHEYPKAITMADGSQVIAESPEEEMILTAKEDEIVDVKIPRRGRPPKSE